jgi:hypothetical protein
MNVSACIEESAHTLEDSGAGSEMERRRVVANVSGVGIRPVVNSNRTVSA